MLTDVTLFYSVILDGCKLKLVSKELNHFGVIAEFFQDWAPGTLTQNEG